MKVGAPRFYINVIEWLASTGLDISDKFRTLPVNPSFVEAINVPSESTPLLVDSSMDKFIFVLGHNLGSINHSVDMSGVITSDGIINSPGNTYDGFSLFNYTGDLSRIIVDGDVGSFVVGNTYTMSNSSDLSLTMNVEYNTNETLTNIGGSLSNTMWTKPPAWGNLGAWELGDSSGNFGIPGNPEGVTMQKSGRRSWDLKFSYMDDGDLWGSSQHLGSLSSDSPGVYTPVGSVYGASADDYDSGDITEGYEGSFAFNYNILTDSNFYSQVWHRTLGGTLPFIFQPDSLNFNPDQFCIAKFKNNSLKATQSAFNMYNINLSIEEVW